MRRRLWRLRRFKTTSSCDSGITPCLFVLYSGTSLLPTREGSLPFVNPEPTFIPNHFTFHFTIKFLNSCPDCLFVSQGDYSLGNFVLLFPLRFPLLFQFVDVCLCS